MALRVICVVLLGFVALSSSLQCESTRCSQEYSARCPPDTSAQLYDNSEMTQSTCNRPIRSPRSLSANCYDTCVVGHELYGPLKCCADLIRAPEVMSVDRDPVTSAVVVDIHPPAAGSNFYQLNKFCKYNIQCPSKEHMLYYRVVNIDIEPPDASGQCLDFLRFSFTATGGSITSDLCGTHKNLPDHVTRDRGFHGSQLTLDFRSNRVHNRGDFYLGVACTLPTAKTKSAYKNRQTSYRTCSPSQTLRSKSVVNYNPQTAKGNFDKVFRGSFTSRHNVIVKRGGVVKYRNRVIIVEYNGKILHRFGLVRKLQVYNRIEGYLNFVGSSTPSGRVFPGYGFLRVGRTGTAQFVQTIVDPKYLLSNEEEEIVRQLFEERYNRIKLKMSGDDNYAGRNLNCGINNLAKQNTASCSEVVKAVANLFVRTDSFQNYCY